MSRAAARTLATARSMMRFVRENVIVVPPQSSKFAATASASTPSDVVINGKALNREELQAGNRWFRSLVLDLYRENQTVNSKSSVKQARAAATDVLACFAAVSAQQELFGAYKGADVDSKDQRAAVARFVGFELPKVQAALAGSAGEKYKEAVASQADDPKSLTGVDNIKAQLYGVDAVLAEKARK